MRGVHPQGRACAHVCLLTVRDHWLHPRAPAPHPAPQALSSYCAARLPRVHEVWSEPGLHKPRRHAAKNAAAFEPLGPGSSGRERTAPPPPGVVKQEVQEQQQEQQQGVQKEEAGRAGDAVPAPAGVKVSQ